MKKRVIHSIAIILNVILLFLLATLLIQNLGITGYAVASFADYRVYITNAYAEKDVSFIIPIDNGEEPINNAYAEITIFDSKGEEIKFLETGSISLEASEKSELRTTWFGSALEGTYQARILIFNDDQSYSFTKNFKLEKETLLFESVIVHDFELGGIINMSALIQNTMNEPVENVSISILILDENEETLSEILSEKKSIQANSISEFEILWNTKGIQSDRYNAKMVINYGKEFIDRDLIINIGDGDFEIIGVGYSIANTPSQPTNNNLMFILIILLVVANLVWLVYYFKTKTSKAKN